MIETGNWHQMPYIWRTLPTGVGGEKSLKPVGYSIR
jgi:hypothetical protein